MHSRDTSCARLCQVGGYVSRPRHISALILGGMSTLTYVKEPASAMYARKVNDAKRV